MEPLSTAHGVARLRGVACEGPRLVFEAGHRKSQKGHHTSDATLTVDRELEWPATATAI
jgi:hypothetical protein